MLGHDGTVTGSSTDKPKISKWSTIENVPLFNGNLVLDCPAPRKLVNQLPVDKQEIREFTHMRYSAATCDPRDFDTMRFTLRQNLYKLPRSPELFIVVTMYNEDDLLLARTLTGVFQNVNYMENLKKSDTWGENSWRKITVCIVSDGAQKINPRSRALLAGLGVYQAGISPSSINDKPISSHIFEVY
jgi:chitin synthase